MIYIAFLSIGAVISTIRALAYLEGEELSYGNRIIYNYYFAPIFVVLAYHFAIYFVNNSLTRFQRISLYASYSAAVLFSTAFFMDSEFIVVGVREGLLGQFLTVPGSLIYLYMSYLILMFSLTAKTLLTYYRTHKSPIVRMQTLYLLFGISLIIGGRIISNVLRLDAFFVGFNPVSALTALGIALQIIGLKKYWFESVSLVQIPSDTKREYALIVKIDHI